MTQLTAEDIKAMLAEGENVNVEFKECGKAFPKEAWPTYSAFANTHGGWLILGITEHRDKNLPEKFEVVGISDIPKIKDQLGSQLDNPEKVSRNLLTDDDVYTVDINGKPVLVIHVPEADYRQKPIFLHKNKVNHSYKRTFEGDAHLSDEELDMMLRDAYVGDNDMTLMEHYDMRHIDPETLRKYRTAFNLRNNGHTFTDYDDKEFLIQMGGYVIDEASGKEGLTMAGMLMFGKGLVIRSLFPSFRMDYLDLTGISSGSGLKWNERLTYDGRWENNLYNFISFAMSKITFGLPNPGVIKGMVRDDDSPVFMALRESVTNSIIHADFRIEGVLRIEKRDDCIELRNPGLLKLSREKIYRGRHSRSRNPKIQDMLRMIGYGDNIGSGFPLILSAWREESWIQPDLSEDRELHEVTLTLKMASLYGSELMEHVTKMFGSSFSKLTSDEKEFIVLIMAGKCQSNSDLQISTGKNAWEVNHILSNLTHNNFLISHPNGRWTTYEVNSEYTAVQQAADKNQEIQQRNTTKKYNKEIQQRNLSLLQKKIIDLITTDPHITLSSLADKLELTTAAIRYQRNLLEREGVFLVRKGATKKGSWHVKFS